MPKTKEYRGTLPKMEEYGGKWGKTEEFCLFLRKYKFYLQIGLGFDCRDHEWLSLEIFLGSFYRTGLRSALAEFLRCRKLIEDRLQPVLRKKVTSCTLRGIRWVCRIKVP